MIPVGETEYRLCTRPEHYRSCYALDRSLGLARVKLNFPTVRALRGGTVIGFLSTAETKEAIVVHRLTLDPVTGRLGAAVIAIRLVEAYEEVLGKANITQYLAAVDKKNAQLIQTMERILQTKPYAETEHDVWFRRMMA
jgi:hypothetical protein